LLRRSSSRFLKLVFGTIAFLSFLNLTDRSQAFGASENTLWNFVDGGIYLLNYTVSGLTMDKSGNLYGTTQVEAGGAGTVYEVTPPSAPGAYGTKTTLHTFGIYPGDGERPLSGVIADKNGNLYGTTLFGGAYGAGIVFELIPPSTNGGKWTESILWSFGSGTDGLDPASGLIMDNSGNLYGTTQVGGTNGPGTVFELSPPSTPGGAWTESVLWNFGNHSDGANPDAGVILDGGGNLYGTAGGGANGGGIVFELTPPAMPGGSWSESVLWDFGSGSDGAGLNAGVVMDASGNLYGTTVGGGTNAQGTVFELMPSEIKGGNWTESLLWNFGNGSDGKQPFDQFRGAVGLSIDKGGNLYGTTSQGGSNNVGTAFELTPPSTDGGSWNERILWNFGNDIVDGSDPGDGLIMDDNGNLYGTTSIGGAFGIQCCTGGGTVFEINPNGSPVPPLTPTLLTASPRKLSFNKVNADTTSKPKKVTLTVKGAAPAQILAVVASAEFTIGGGPDTCSGQLLEPKNKCSFYVEYAPTVLCGGASGGVSAAYNGGNPGLVGLSGACLTAALKGPKVVSFPSVSAGSVGEPKNVMFSNLSKVTVTLRDLLVGINADSFQIVSDDCSGKALAPKGTCSIGVEFAPSGGAVGTQSAGLTLVSIYGFDNANVTTTLKGKVK
jgi:uncharacterized repeat protein (TIGR03803 family)